MYIHIVSIFLYFICVTYKKILLFYNWNSLFSYPLALTDCQLFLSMFSLLLYMLVNLCSSAAAKKDKKTRFLNQYDAFSMISKIHSCMLAQTMFVILFTSLYSLSAIDMPWPGPLITTQTCRRCWTVIPSGREEGMFSYFSKQTRVLDITSFLFSFFFASSHISVSS